MSRGWGLTLDSDPISLFSNNNPMNHHHHHNAATPARGNIFSPVNLNRGGGDDNNPDHHRMAVGEVDFFADKRRSSDVDSKAGIVLVKKEINSLGVNTGLHLLTTNTGSDQSTLDDGVSSDADNKNRAKNELAVIQAELERVNAENQRLREMLTQVNNNYNALQMHLVALMQQQASRAQIDPQRNQVVEERQDDKRVTPRQFMELGPSGVEEPTQSNSSEERTQSGSLHQRNEIVPHDQEKSNSKGIAREDTPESEGWGPNKVQKLSPGTKPSGHIEQAAATEATMRKARVSVRARSEAPMITDGCQWRKYGQKMAKGNPCPRAYYRCTMAVACPVRKQVQRCAEDKTILITTYEGTHNHPLPPAAMAMASTTSAAASMLLSGSMPSGDGLMNPNFLARTILPCSSNMATISASAPFPTVTLDLTHSPNPLQQFQRPPQPQFQLPFAAPPPGPHVFGQSLGLYNQSQFSGLQVSSQPHMQQQQQQQQQQESSSSQLPQQTQQQQHSFADTLSAATAAITADPNFTAALAAAISSIIGGGHPSSGTPNNTGSASTTNTAATGNNNNIGGFPGN